MIIKIEIDEFEQKILKSDVVCVDDLVIFNPKSLAKCVVDEIKDNYKNADEDDKESIPYEYIYRVCETWVSDGTYKVFEEVRKEIKDLGMNIT